MALPAVMSYCKVTALLLEATADTTDDPDDLPQGNPLVGASISFRAAPSAIKTATPPATTIPRQIECLTDASGYLYNPAGTTVGEDGNAVKRGVYILASDDPDIEPHDWTWSVAIRGDGFSTITGSFVATSGGDIDLSTVVQVPASGGQVTPEWIAAVSATQSARDAAEAARDAAEQYAVAGLAWSGVVDLSAVTGPVLRRATLTGNITGIVLPTLSPGRTVTITLVLVQGATGSRTLTVAGVIWPYGVPPVLSTAPGAIDLIHLLWDGTEWVGLVGGMGLA